MGVEAFVIMSAAFFTVRVIRNVNLLGAIRYLWCLMWLIPIEILFVIGLFDYFRVTDVWFRHWWRDSTMAWFRRVFCEPVETFDNRCAIPIVDNETQYCLDLYNETDCSTIRNAAQSRGEKFMLSYYYVNAAWGLVLVCLVRLRLLRTFCSPSITHFALVAPNCEHAGGHHLSPARTEVSRVQCAGLVGAAHHRQLVGWGDLRVCRFFRLEYALRNGSLMDWSALHRHRRVCSRFGVAIAVSNVPSVSS